LILGVQRPTGEKDGETEKPGRNHAENHRLPNVGDDSDLVTQVAAQLVRQMAGAAAAYAGDLAEIAIGLDDENSAQAWFDIADAAADLIAHLPDPPVSKDSD